VQFFLFLLFLTLVIHLNKKRLKTLPGHFNDAKQENEIWMIIKG
jgi:hypothetical protein